MRNALCAIFLGIAVSGGVLAAQSAQSPRPATPQSSAPAAGDVPVESPPVTFRVQIDYVEVDAIVTDDQGNPVRGLRREDFEVLEDGLRQEVELFSLIDVPVTPPDQPLFSETPIELDVRTNVEFDGRLYVLLLDDLHTDLRRSNLVKSAARDFVERHLAANDLAAVVYLSGRANVGQEFTSSKRLLIESVDKF